MKNKNNQKLSIVALFKKYGIYLAIFLFVAVIFTRLALDSQVKEKSQDNNQPVSTASSEKSTLYPVTGVVDGDTIDVNIDGKVERLRLIGIDTPETVDPRKPVQCFGKEASDKAKELLTNKKVSLEADTTQSERDKYDRLLRYVFLEDGTNFNKWMVENGYAFEYTYDSNPYKYQKEFQEAQRQARESGKGLWASTTCNGESKPATTEQTKSTNSNCEIKGNISSSGEKIYHMPDQQYYDKTVIDESKGEKWFCSESEAVSAGWRKSKK